VLNKVVCAPANDVENVEGHRHDHEKVARIQDRIRHADYVTKVAANCVSSKADVVAGFSNLGCEKAH
jgi:hypothetical protein